MLAAGDDGRAPTRPLAGTRAVPGSGSRTRSSSQSSCCSWSCGTAAARPPATRQSIRRGAGQHQPCAGLAPEPLSTLGCSPPPISGPRDTAVPSRPHAWYVAAGTRSGTEDPLGTAVPWPTPALLPPGASALTPGSRWSICACRALQHQMGSPVTRGPCHRLGTSSRGRRKEAEGWERLRGGIRHPPPLGGCPSPPGQGLAPRGAVDARPWRRGPGGEAPVGLRHGAEPPAHSPWCYPWLGFFPLNLSPLTTLGIALCLLLLCQRHQPGCCAARWDTAPPRPAPLLR